MLLFSRQANPLFHLIKILGEGAAASRCKPVFGARHSSFEEFYARNVFRFFKFARVHAQVTVGGLKDALEIVKCERLVCGERADDAQADALVNQTIEFRQLGSVSGFVRSSPRLFPCVNAVFGL